LRKFLLFNVVAFSTAAFLYSQSKSDSGVEERRLEDLPFLPSGMKHRYKKAREDAEKSSSKGGGSS
jgi:hypothetical protein